MGEIEGAYEIDKNTNIGIATTSFTKYVSSKLMIFPLFLYKHLARLGIK